MSVINQMLKDLDERKSVSQSGTESLIAAERFEQASKVRTYQIALVALLFILILAVIYIVMNRATENDLETPSLQNQQIVSSNENTKEELLTITPEPVVSVKTTPEIKESLNTEMSENNADIVDIKPSLAKQNLEIVEHTETQKSETQKEEKKSIESQEAAVLKKSDEVQSIEKSIAVITPRQEAEKFHSEGLAYKSAGQTEEAIRAFNAALEKVHELHPARIQLLTLLMQNKNYEAMTAHLETGLNQWPEIHEYRQIQARLLMIQGEGQKALSLLQQNIPDVSRALDYHALLAYSAQQENQHKIASQHYQLLLQQQPAKADWWLGLAVSEEQNGNKDLALNAYRQSVSRPGLSASVSQYARQRIKVLQGF